MTDTPPRESSPALPSLTLPKGGGALQGIGEKFAANPVTGTGSMTVPIPVSPGRSGFGPQLSLSYDSGAGNGPFGFGWLLSVPMVRRQTDKGLPLYCDTAESDVYVFSGTEDLVPVLDTGNVRHIDTTSAPGFIIHRYRPRVEGLFARIERWTALTTGEIHWRSITRDNVTTIYGSDDDSRVFDPDDPDPAHPSRIFTWLLRETYDDRGNVARYEYLKEDDAGVDTAQANERSRIRGANRYLKRIRYGNRESRLAEPDAKFSWLFEVVFDYDEGHYDDLPLDPGVPEAAQHRFVRATATASRPWAARPDPFSSYRSCFEIRTHRRCRRVLMFHLFPELGADPCLVRATEFDYADFAYPPVGTSVDAELAHHGSTHFASFLCAVTHSGFVRDTQTIVDPDGVRRITYLKKSLPPLEFEYSKARIHDEVREPDADSLENLPVGLDGSLYKWVDLDGEGISGILCERAGAWHYKPNLGDGRFGPLQTLPSQPSSADLTNDAWQLLDLSGDGQLDVVCFDESAPGFYERTPNGSWESFRALRCLPNLRWSDPNLRFVDLDGDGHADVLISEDDAFTFHLSYGERGYGPASKARLPHDEERGPRMVFADPTHSIFLADMSGDGLTDLVRIRNGEVCYWPNLGHGRFGPKVTMDASPWFDAADQFDPRRVRLADIDGSGTTDVIYLGIAKVCIYFNQSGNRWSAARLLLAFPHLTNLAAITTVDLRGTGTASLVWSSPLPADASRPLRTIDLLDGQKPHLLIGSRNNLGAETRVRYAPSTKFYLADKRVGKPWITRIPFPVHVLERIETYDRLSRNLFVTRYAYHHGHFDGVEREFRGFGMVEQWDTESLATLSGDIRFPVADNIDASSHVPPVLTRTWYHTGIHLGRDRVSDFFAGLRDADDLGEYYREPEATAAGAKELLLPDTVLPSGLTAEEEHQACRALKGSLLRQEVYSLDNTGKQQHPHTVLEQNFTIERVQGRGDNRHAVFFIHARESILHHYERALFPVLAGEIVDDTTAAADPTVQWLPDPRVTHTLTLEVDAFGDILRSATISYGRRFRDRRLPRQADRDEQSRIWITYQENRFTKAVDIGPAYRAPLPCEARTYEFTGLTMPGTRLRFDFDEVAAASASAAPLDYEKLPTSGVWQKRLIEHVRTLYRRDDLVDALALGDLELRALPFESYKLAFTPGLVTELYAGRVSDAMLRDEGRYGHGDGDTAYWIPSGRLFYSPRGNDSPAEELAYALEHFFLPCRYRDPFHTALTNTESIVTYDTYDLLLEVTRDPLENHIRVREQNYRVLQPSVIMDPNRNCAAVKFDALGMVAGTAVMGKPEDVPAVGDRLGPVFSPDLTQAEIDQFFADPKGPTTQLLLGDATTRVIHDLLIYFREPNPARKSPTYVATLARESHASDPIPAAGLQIQRTFVYSDGFGREIQKKVQAEPGPTPLRDAAGDIIIGADGRPHMTPDDTSPRWVGTGWTVFNNKGKPVRQYEPYFTDTHRFELAVRVGVSPVIFYDPLGRVIATLMPNHTWQKIVFDPWRQETWDVSDTVLIADPVGDRDVGAFFARLPINEYLPTWYARRQAGALGSEEQTAARKSVMHASTPTIVHADALGHTFLTVEHNRYKYGDALPVEEHYATRVMFDIEGNQRIVIDATDRRVVEYGYDMLGNRSRQASMEAGERWMLGDVTGKPLYTWDDRGHRFHIVRDKLRRPIGTFLSAAADPIERLIERSVFGETEPIPEVKNQRGKLVRVFDQAGVATTDEYDFKGNLLRNERRFAQSYKDTLDWQFDAPLEPETYTRRTRYDALNRPVTATSPDRSVHRSTYNEAGLLERIDVNLRGTTHNGSPVWTTFVTDIDYDAKGQRVAVHYGPDGLRTTYEYDPLSLRLTRLITRRDPGIYPGDCPSSQPPSWPGCQVQNLRYTYDPAGNITHIRDFAQQAVYFRNSRVEPSTEYTYDAIHRLVEAVGREHLGQIDGPPSPHSYNDASHARLLHPGGGRVMGRYIESYLYDAVGNILAMQHRGLGSGAPGWKREYTYDELSQLEPGRRSNRLTRTTVGPTTETYSTAGDGYDAHGNMLRMPQLREMQWDFRNQLRMTQRQAVSASDTEGTSRQGERTYYVYDAAGQRVRKVAELAGGQRRDERLYLSDFEVYLRHGASPLTRETLHVMDDARRVATVETRTLGAEPSVPTQLVRYQFENHIGSASLELDDQARVVSYEEYTPFGCTAYQAVRNLAEAPRRYRYTGKERDEESGLYYHGARYYAPWLGRWTSCDPKWLADSFSGFVYVRNNPVRLNDPTGEQGSPGLWDRVRTYVRGSAPVQLGLGIVYGTAQAFTPLGFLAPTPAPDSRAFEFGRGAGETATGIVQMFVGGSAIVGGGGAAAGGVIATPASGGASLLVTAGGASVVAAGVVAVAQGGVNVIAGIRTMAMSISREGPGSGSTPSTPSQPEPEPTPTSQRPAASTPPQPEPAPTPTSQRPPTPPQPEPTPTSQRQAASTPPQPEPAPTSQRPAASTTPSSASAAANLFEVLGEEQGTLVRQILKGRQPLTSLSEAERQTAARWYRGVAERTVGRNAVDARLYNIARAEYLEGTRTSIEATIVEFIRNNKKGL